MLILLDHPLRCPVRADVVPTSRAFLGNSKRRTGFSKSSISLENKGPRDHFSENGAVLVIYH